MCGEIFELTALDMHIRQLQADQLLIWVMKMFHEKYKTVLLMIFFFFNRAIFLRFYFKHTKYVGRKN